jgi:hypothetical protein
MIKCLLVINLLLVVCNQLAFADEWQVSGLVDQSMGYDDNVTMRPDPLNQGSFWYRITPVLNLIHRTEATEIKTNATYGTQVYSDIPSFSQDFQNYGLDSIFKTEMIDWKLGFNYSITPTRNLGYQTGNFSSAAFNESWSINPAMIIKLNDIDKLIFSPGYSESSFTRQSGTDPADINTNFRDYNTIDMSLTWQRLWSERYNSTVSLFGSILDSQSGNQNSLDNIRDLSNTSVGINFGNNYLIDEKWIIDGTIGVRNTETVINSVSSSSVGFLANVGVNYKDDDYTAGFYFNRSLNPSNFGSLQEQTGVGFNFNYSVLKNLSVNLNANYQKSTIVNNNQQQLVNLSSQRSRQNIVIEPSVHWNFLPEWSLTGSYRYRTQDKVTVDSTVGSPEKLAESNLFMLSVNYNWQGIKFSR